MHQQPHADIISCNTDCSAVCASAARISTTQGTADEIFAAAREHPGNLDLIGKVLRSGHKSVIEHAVFTVAFCNVSVFVEQFFIESRLASFTVKSRRYVDFRGFGYYVPPALEGSSLDLYRRYMDGLFAAYGRLVDAGVPKEDARFVLPYSFHSNFYCTLNARELVHILRAIRYGRGRGNPELAVLAEQLTAQAAEFFPSLLSELDRVPSGENAPSPSGGIRVSEAPCFVEARDAAAVQLLSAPQAPLEILRAAWRVGAPGTEFSLDALLASERPRELEQLSCSFRIDGLTLSGLTHLVRHRMQSIVIPPVGSVDHGRYIVPGSIREIPGAWEIYSGALEAAHEMLGEIRRVPALEPFACYFAVSGNLIEIMTTMNARELRLFFRLRTCNRAQWEIRGVATTMLHLLREQCPDLFGRFGPSCCLLGYCPEGRLSCGKIDEVRAAFQIH